MKNLFYVFLFSLISFNCQKELSSGNGPTSGLPTLITTAIISIAASTATSGGNISSDGGATVTVRGVCWGTTTGPVVSGNHTTDGNGTGSFTSRITGLRTATIYYVRAYATNSVGTAYGNELSFTTIFSDPVTMIYLAGRTNDLYALNATTGKVIWSKKIIGNQATSAIYSNGNVIVRSWDDNLTAFDTLGNLKWTYKLLGNTSSPNDIALTVEAGIIYTQDLDYMYAIESSTGALKWKYFKNDVYLKGNGTMVLYNHTIYCNNFNGDLLAVDAETGNLIWKNYIAVQSSTPIVFKDNIYVPLGSVRGGLEVYDTHTGALKWSTPNFNSRVYNIRYGRIYSAGGQVTDSSTGTIAYPNMQIPLTNYVPEGTVYPILADNLAIMSSGVADAFTGTLLCIPPNPYYSGGSSGAELSGATYVNNILYYTTSQKDFFDPSTGGHFYSHAYAYDVSSKQLLWISQIENADFFQMEPCVVTKAGKVFRGSFTFQ